MKDTTALTVNDVLEVFETSLEGLTTEEAMKRLIKHGPNMLVEKKGMSTLGGF